MGKFDKLAKLLGVSEKYVDDAAKVIEAVDNPELATSLTGDVRGQYLDALTEVYGPKNQRIKDMGFGDKNWFHGTTVPIDEFKKEALGLSTGAQSSKKGFFFASDPSTASDYANLAADKGIIREGDNITTKFMSENFEEPIGYGVVDEARSLWNNAKNAENYNKSVLRQISDYENIRKSPPDWVVKSAQREKFNSVSDFVDSRINKIKEKIIPVPGKKEVDALKQNYSEAFIKFNSTNPELASKINEIYLKGAGPEEKEFLEKAIKTGSDYAESQGQNVGKFRLKGSPEDIHVKNYKGAPYRDSTYSDEMQKALDEKKSGVLFKNTYDPAGPDNRVKQNIAAVFEPNQIRSEYAAFDPRFAKSPLLLAGAGAIPSTDMNPLPKLQELLGDYESKREEVNKALANQLNLSGDKEVTENISNVLGVVADPINAIPGIGGVVAGLASLLAKKKK